MIDVMIQGISGRMGHVLCDLIEKREDCRVVCGVDRYIPENPAVPTFPSFEEVNISADVLIDFSNASAVDPALDYCSSKKIPCVICTTGLSDETLTHLKETSEKVAVFRSANMSMGINLLIDLAKKAVELLGMDYDIEIVERHHNNKVDAPSGTALMIADEINKTVDGRYHYVYDRQSTREKRDPYEIGFSAIRGGTIVGDHDVLFCGPDEVITLSHSAYSRTVFANGAVNAAVFVADKKPGLYTMDQLIQDSVKK